MLLYSGRNVLVHPCKSFLTWSAVGCRESDTFKNAFFHKILIRDLGIFRLVCVSRLTDFNEICQNEGNGGSPNADQIWRCCVNIWGYTAPKICIKTIVFGSRR